MTRTESAGAEARESRGQRLVFPWVTTDGPWGRVCTRVGRRQQPGRLISGEGADVSQHSPGSTPPFCPASPSSAAPTLSRAVLAAAAGRGQPTWGRAATVHSPPGRCGRDEG